MTKHKDLPYIQHILDAIEDIEESVRNFSEEQFGKNKDVKDSNIRRLEILGEAVKNISDSLKKKYPKIPWKEIAGTRDKMIHQYFGVDLEIVWNIITKEIPKLKKEIKQIKKELLIKNGE